jgi:predicted nucleotidyltransferase component of viral defense system
VIKSILSEKQKKFLSLFSLNANLANEFYLTGGTALTEFYIPYRLSEDLDFFSEKEVDIELITVFLKSIKNEVEYKTIDINTSFNRNIIQLIFNKENLKLEFTYFPFPQIEKPLKKQSIKVDSILDIATNKIFTIYQKPRSRDFIDLYMINKKYNFLLEDLVKKAKIKFDWHIDPIKLGSQFLLVDEVKDYPNLIKPINNNDWKEFFKLEAKKLTTKIFK